MLSYFFKRTNINSKKFVLKWFIIMFLTQNPQLTVYIRTPEPPWSRRSVSRWKIGNFKLFLHEKTQTGVSFIPGWLYDIVSRLHDDASFHISVILRCDSNSETVRMRYPFQSTDRPISHRNGWSFRVYMMPVRDFVPEWNFRPGTTTGVN